MEDGSPTNSVVLWVILADNDNAGRRMAFVTTHLKAKEDKESRNIRQQQAAHLIKVLGDLGDGVCM